MAEEITGLEEVLGYQTLSKMVAMFPYVPAGLDEVFPARPIRGDTAEWDVFKGGRGVAEANARGAHSRDRALEKVAQKTATCIHLFDSKKLPGDLLNNLREPGSKEKAGRATLAREAQELRSLHRRTREYYMAAALSGTLTINQADVKLTVNYGFSNSHKPTAGTSWNTASTDIIGDIETWKDLIRQDSGLEPARAFCNTTVMQYLLKNTAVQKFMGAGAYATQVGKTGRITELVGLKITVIDAGYVNSSDSFTKFINDDKFIITPAPGDWAALQAGTCMVPNEEDELVEVECPAAYVDVSRDPAVIKLLEHDVVLPVITIPAAIVYADTTP